MGIPPVVFRGSIFLMCLFKQTQKQTIQLLRLWNQLQVASFWKMQNGTIISLATKSLDKPKWRFPCWRFSFFPTCQVRVVRFYVSCRSFSSSSASSGPQPRLSTPSVRCRTSSLPDLNHDQPRPVFAAGPQPWPATPSVRCRTSTTTSHAQCSLPDLNHDQPRPVFAAGPQPRPSTPSVRCRTSTPMPKAMPDRMSEDMPDRTSEDMTDRMSEDMPDRMSEDTSDRMPDRTSDRVPDRMPEKNAR